MLDQCRNELSMTLAQHYSNTGSAVYLAAAPQQTRAIYPIILQCWPNVFAVGPTLKQHWVIVPCLLPPLCWWRFAPPIARKATTQITHTLAQHYSSLILSSPDHDIIMNILIFSAFFKNATIWPSDLKCYIWHLHKDRNVNRFPHTTPHFPQIKTQTLLQ